MVDLGKLFSLLGTVFLILVLLFNLKPDLPKVPGDLYLNKAGFKIYIPWLSSIIISLILTLLLNYFRK